MEDMDTDLPTPGDVGLALGVARSTELCGFRLHAAEAPLTQGMNRIPPAGLPARPAGGAPGAGVARGPRGADPDLRRPAAVPRAGRRLDLALRGRRRGGRRLRRGRRRRHRAAAALGACGAWRLHRGRAGLGRRLQRARDAALLAPRRARTRSCQRRFKRALRWSDIAIAPRGKAAFTAFVGGTVIDGWWRTGPAVLSWADDARRPCSWVIGLGNPPIVGAETNWQCPSHFRSSHKGLTDGHLRCPGAVDTAHRRDAPSPSNDAHGVVTACVRRGDS